MGGQTEQPLKAVLHYRGQSDPPRNRELGLLLVTAFGTCCWGLAGFMFMGVVEAWQRNVHIGLGVLWFTIVALPLDVLGLIVCARLVVHKGPWTTRAVVVVSSWVILTVSICAGWITVEAFSRR
jgi:hypothetical protein